MLLSKKPDAVRKMKRKSVSVHLSESVPLEAWSARQILEFTRVELRSVEFRRTCSRRMVKSWEAQAHASCN